MIPYFLGFNSSIDFISFGSDKISTFISKYFNSSLVILSNLGSSVDADIAFLIISSAIEFVTGKNVPIHPLNSPNLWIDTNTPALFSIYFFDIAFGISIIFSFKI